MPAPGFSKQKASALRLTALSALLAFVGFAFYNDSRLAVEADLLNDQLSRLEEAADSSCGPEKVHTELKRQPNRSFKVGRYEVEEYKQRRTIPLMAFPSLFAIYENGVLFKVVQGASPTVEMIEKPSGMGEFEPKQKRDTLK